MSRVDAIGTPIATPIASTREIERVISELAAVQHNVVARWQLLERGISKSAIKHRLSTGRLHRVRPGVYRCSAARLTVRGRWMADVLACGPECGLGADTALQLIGVRNVNRRRTTVISARRGRRAPKGIDLRTSRNVEFITWDGIPVTPLPRALVDAAPQLDDEQLEAALERAVVDHELDLNSIPQSNRRLNDLVKDVKVGMALTDSELENLFLGIIKRAGLPRPKSNQWLWTGERHYKPDFLWAEHRLIAEVDGWGVHRAQTEADRRREAHLAALGFVVQRFTKLQLVRRPEEVVRAVAAFVS